MRHHFITRFQQLNTEALTLAETFNRQQLFWIRNEGRCVNSELNAIKQNKLAYFKVGYSNQKVGATSQAAGAPSYNLGSSSTSGYVLIFDYGLVITSHICYQPVVIRINQVEKRDKRIC